jgi:Txe/YoeB family toxin of toxin-antitoxin system
MVNWKIVYAKQALKDAKKLKSSGLKKNAENLIKILEQDPFKTPPRYEKLIGDLEGAYSRRINIQHRLVYQVYSELKIIKVLRLWSHYD